MDYTHLISYIFTYVTYGHVHICTVYIYIHVTFQSYLIRISRIHASQLHIYHTVIFHINTHMSSLIYITYTVTIHVHLFKSHIPFVMLVLHTYHSCHHNILYSFLKHTCIYNKIPCPLYSKYHTPLLHLLFNPYINACIGTYSSYTHIFTNHSYRNALLIPYHINMYLMLSYTLYMYIQVIHILMTLLIYITYISCAFIIIIPISCIHSIDMLPFISITIMHI